jgi:uncharacterized protein (DUF433 family)
MRVVCVFSYSAHETVNRRTSFGRLVRSQVESAEAKPRLCGLGGLAAMTVEKLLERNPEKMGGVPVFAGTRVPVEFLFQFLEDDQTLETFLDHFPTVSRAQVKEVLNASRDLLLSA